MRKSWLQLRSFGDTGLDAPTRRSVTDSQAKDEMIRVATSYTESGYEPRAERLGSAYLATRN